MKNSIYRAWARENLVLYHLDESAFSGKIGFANEAITKLC